MYFGAICIAECLAGAVDPDVHLFVADIVKSFDTVDRGILVGFGMRAMSIMQGFC